MKVYEKLHSQFNILISSEFSFRVWCQFPMVVEDKNQTSRVAYST